MILYNCNFMMYSMRFHTGFLFGGWDSECTSPGPASSPSSLEDSATVASSVSSSQSGSVTAFTSEKFEIVQNTTNHFQISKLNEIYIL